MLILVPFVSHLHIHRERRELDAGTETNVNLNHEVYYHFLGTDQSMDILCWRDPEHPKYIYGTYVTDDGKVINYMIICLLVSKTNRQISKCMEG